MAFCLLTARSREVVYLRLLNAAILSAILAPAPRVLPPVAVAPLAFLRPVAGLPPVPPTDPRPPPAAPEAMPATAACLRLCWPVAAPSDFFLFRRILAILVLWSLSQLPSASFCSAIVIPLFKKNTVSKRVSIREILPYTFGVLNKKRGPGRPKTTAVTPVAKGGLQVYPQFTRERGAG